MIWKAATALMDKRTVWPRAILCAIAMIEERDPGIVRLQKQIRAKANVTA